MNNRIKLLILALSMTAMSCMAVTVQEAKKYVTDGDYAKAIAAYRTLMQQSANAKNADCNKFFGQALCMSGAYEESIPYLEFGAKNNKSGALWYLGISRQHLYDFEGAIEALEKYKTKMSKGSLWIPRTDSIIAECQLGLKAVNHVQDVVIIDSMMVPKKVFFAHYKLGSESGRMLTAQSCGGDIVQLTGSGDAAVFENQAADYRMFAAQDEDGYHLYETHLFAGEWSEPQAVESIDAGTRRLCYPFLRSDSETLFFACDSTPGFGGFDIYKTHFNAESNSYYTPERMGMPFNSPYNDYMLAIDETHQVGWWATDRNASEGMVCVYLFIVDETPKYLDESSPERARVSSIADTWINAEGYANLVSEVMNAPQFVEVKEIVRIPINDNLVYTSIDDFKNAKAREAYEKSLHTENTLHTLTEELDRLRAEWRTATEKRRKELRTIILQQEKRELQLIDQLHSEQKTYRNLEAKK